MTGNKLWYFITLCMLSLLPLTGCSGTAETSRVDISASKAEATFVGQVDQSLLGNPGEASKSAATALNTVDVINAQNGAVLGTATIDASGNFKDLKVTLPAAKSVVVFKAVVAAGTFRSVVPIDLESNLPTAGTIVGSQPVIININAETTEIAQLVSKSLGLTGILGDDGQTLTSVSKAYADAYAAVVTNGGVTLGYAGSGSFSIQGGVNKPGSGVVLEKAAESCAVCHKASDVDTAHGLANFPELAISVPVVTSNGTDLVATFNVKRNGANAAMYTQLYKRNASASPFAYRLDGPTKNRVTLTTSFANNGNGNYTVTIIGGAANAAVNSRYLFRLSDLPTGSTIAGPMVLFDYPASPVTDVLGDSTSCEDCHGTLGNGFHYGSPAYGGKTCVVCHDAANQNYPLLPALIHGIHQSGNMPTGKYTAKTRDGAKSWDFAIHFPSYMSNCSICHKTGAPLTAANSKAVTYDLCMTCHQNWDGFGDSTFGGLTAHKNMTTATNCAPCHEGTIAASTVGTAHNKANAGLGLITGRSGLIVSGDDLSVTEGAKVALNVTGVTRTGNELAITWTATYNGAAVDPCNATATTTAPAFAYAATTASATQRALSAQNFSILRAYFLGDDLVNANNGSTAPGQALATNLVFAAGATQNTTCSANVATTKITLPAKEAALTGKARIALQGKPQMVTAAGVKHLVRAKTPTYDFNLATGTKAADRRPVTDTSKCLKCHVGSLYQHGGNRVDNVEMCVMCHNEASNEKNVRVGLGITSADKTYDGKIGQTYGFKSMLHAIHASGTPGFSKAIAVYRSNGIYTFAYEQAALYNWPGTGTQTIFGSTPPVTRGHNFVVAHYPRALNDCTACHTSNFTRIPDPAKAVATTLDPGAAPWDNQLDDVLQGPVSAACISCHSGAAASAHAIQNSWNPAVLKNGRQTVIDTAK